MQYHLTFLLLPSITLLLKLAIFLILYSLITINFPALCLIFYRTVNIKINMINCMKQYILFLMHKSVK